MRNNKKLVLATLIAPLAAPSLYCLAAIVLHVIRGGNDSGLVRRLAIYFIVATPISYIASIFLGLPYYNALRWKNCLSFSSLMIGGVVLGGITMLLFSVFGLGETIMTTKHLLSVIGLGAFLGGGVAFSFRCISGITRRSTRPR